jgi:hypothetical protein
LKFIKGDDMRRALGIGLSIAVIATPLMIATNGSASAPSVIPAAVAMTHPKPANKTVATAGPQHWCGTNGIECTEPALDWDEFAGFKQATQAGAHISGYIGHDEPATLFYSNRPGSGNDVTYQLRLPKDPPTTPRQNGSGGTDDFQLHATFWLGMVVCDNQGSPNPDGQALTGHATLPCKPDSNSNIFNSQDPNSSKYFGLGPGQAYEEMQFYPPGWAPWPAGLGCTATQWCAAMNIDTFSENVNTGQFNNVDCLNTVGPEPVNFAFLTKNGKAADPASPQHPEHFTPNLARDFLMNDGDNLKVRLSDTANGLRVLIHDRTTHTQGAMTASKSNGFGSVVFDPNAKKCQVTPFDFHPEFSTSTPATRNVAAAHTYNVAFSDEIGHFEYCGKVGTDANSTCLKPLGADTNDGDTAGQDPLGDDVFCLPASASLKVKIGGCLNTDGDFDGASYNFTWPGSISNPTADQLLNPRSFLFSSPTTGGRNFSTMAFESDISRDESDDTAFRTDVTCQRHLLNPSDPHPGVGCVNPPPNSVFYPFYTTQHTANGCMWQEGGPYIPGTTHEFGGSAQAEYGPLRAISYPSTPFGTITKRFNDFRRNLSSLPCPAAGAR